MGSFRLARRRGGCHLALVMIVVCACLLPPGVGERGASAAPATPPAPTPVVSRDAPAFASAGASSARLADDTDYSSAWRPGTTGAWLAYDLSGLPRERRGRVLLAWYAETDVYDHSFFGDDAPPLPVDYRVEAHPAPGGGEPPATGWVTLATVAGNTLHSRQHPLDLAGHNWVRLAIDGAGSAGLALNLDVHDASQGADDGWIFFGSSSNATAMDHNARGPGTFAQQIAERAPGRFPPQENGGIGGTTSGDGARLLPGWLPLFPGRYVALTYGLNDANYAAPGAVDPDAFYRNYVDMVETVLAAGKVPVISTVPWARTASARANVPPLNARLGALFAAYPEIVRGPDLYGFFSTNQGLISDDDLHPSDEGMTTYRRLWAGRAVATVYDGGAPTRECFAETGHCVQGRFLAYWRAHGGLALNGLPLTEERVETLEDGRDYTVQYFERTRLEYHPENPAPYDVLLGQFGRRIHPADPAAPPLPDAVYFDATGHNLWRGFLAYWRANGGLEQFGYPISEEIRETIGGRAYTVQYFERARFEYHPEHAGTPYEVQLGQFGRRILEGR